MQLRRRSTLTKHETGPSHPARQSAGADWLEKQKSLHTWSVLSNHNSPMVQPDIRGGGRALVGQGVLLLHLEGDAAGAAVSGGGVGVGGGG